MCSLKDIRYQLIRLKSYMIHEDATLHTVPICRPHLLDIIKETPSHL